ncbi:conserved predicted protein [Escherichia coli]|nr:conserved predicted protein [Escherichia coli]CAD5791239.1 conserved predicted protein [Escherichia coli]CAD5791348.1 conserved predicted protein [Escherichia coli]
MTFCGDLLFVPSGINHHLFENLRRKGHHCHGRKRLSGGRPQKFLPAFGQKVLRDVHFTPGLAETVVAVFAPGDRGLNRCMAPDTTTGRDPPQRREARFAKRRCPLHPGGLLPGCRERRPRRDRGGATVPVAASQGFASGMEARQGGDSFAGSVHDSPPRQGDARKRHSRENNRTDRNESSRKKKNSSSSSSSSSSRNNNIISNRQMTGLKKQKLTAERPRNERGGA